MLRTGSVLRFRSCVGRRHDAVLDAINPVDWTNGVDNVRDAGVVERSSEFRLASGAAAQRLPHSSQRVAGAAVDHLVHTKAAHAPFIRCVHEGVACVL